LLGALIGVPTGVAAAFNRDGAEDRTVRGAGLLGEAMPPFLLGLLLLLVFFRWLDIAPAPSGRISVVLTPPTTVTGSYFIDSILMQDSIAARSALGQLMLPVATLALLIAATLTLHVRNAILAELQTAHFAYARAQGMSRDMLTAIALRGAAPTIWRAVTNQFAALLGTTAVVEYVFAWGGVGHYGLDAMTKADFPAVQGFILLSGAFALIVHGLHSVIRRVGRLRFRRT
jgi:ABC-type dipeptide/oligopeptide/nickel transport system permease component